MHLSTFSICILGHIWKIAERSEVWRWTESSRLSSSEGKKVSFQLDWILIKMFQYVVLALVGLHATCLLFHKNIFRLFLYSLPNICMIISGWKAWPVVCICAVLASHSLNRHTPHPPPPFLLLCNIFLLFSIFSPI